MYEFRYNIPVNKLSLDIEESLNFYEQNSLIVFVAMPGLRAHDRSDKTLLHYTVSHPLHNTRN